MIKQNLKNILSKIILLIVLVCSSNTLLAQDAIDEQRTVTVIDSSNTITETNNLQTGLFPKQLESVLRNISISGYYRFITNYTYMSIPYLVQPTVTQNEKTVFIGDDSQMPQLMLNIGGKPTANTTFGTDFYLWNKMTGLTPSDYHKGLNLGVNLYGTYSTKYANFNVMTGGIHWYSLSPFTFSSNTGYNRYTIFERNPWDPATKSVEDRYKNLYQNGALTQDIRWGQQAFQGIIFEINDLPKGFSIATMYGKTQQNGLGTIPSLVEGGKIKKSFGTDFISLNTFNSNTYTDSLNNNTYGFNIFTTEYYLSLKKLVFKGELGAGRYFSPVYQKGWGEAISAKFSFPKEYTFFPIELRYYRISPKVVNNNSSFFNSSINEANLGGISTDPLSQQTGQLVILVPFASSIVPIGQLTNNRQGIELNADIAIKKLKISFGNNIASEIDNISSQITYGHAANNLALSRFWRWNFVKATGPYGNISTVYRGVYETVNLTDTLEGKPKYQKYFNTMEINAKYFLKVLGRDVYINYLGSFSSVQKKVAAIPVFTESAYIRAYYHQIETYIKLTSKIVWANYFGWERIICNYDTQVDAITRRPKNQEGKSFATGFDISISKNAGLYVRQRWMNYRDTSFEKDKYKGTETTVEIKIFF